MKPEKKKNTTNVGMRGLNSKNPSKAKKVEALATFTCGTLKKRAPEATVKLDESAKDFYLLQISGLEYQLERYQRLCDRLQIKLQDDKTVHDDQDQEKTDVISHLSNTLNRKSEELDSTGKQLQDLQLTSHVERQAFEAQTLQLNRMLADTKDRMNDEIYALKALLKSMEKYQLEREEVESKMETILEEMEETRISQRMQLHSFERQRVVDLNRLRNDVSTRLIQLATAFGKDMNRRISQTTRDAIQENVDNVHMLTVQSKVTEFLIKENDDLKREVTLLKRKIETMELFEKNIVRRNCSLKEVLRLMRDRCVAMETALKESEKLKMDFESAVKTVEDLNAALLKTTKDSQQMLQNENTRLMSALSDANEQTAKVNHVNVQLRRLLSEAAYVLKKALETSSSEDCEKSDYEITVMRNAVVHQLSVLFGSAAVLGVDNDVVEETEQEEVAEEEKAAEGLNEEEGMRHPRCNVDAATAFQRVITSQRPSRVLPARWRQQSLSPQYRPGHMGAVPLRLSTQQPRIRSANVKKTEPPASRFSFVNRITAALLDL